MHRLLRKCSSGLAVLVLVGAASVIAAPPAAAVGPCTTTCYVDASLGNDLFDGNALTPFAGNKFDAWSISPRIEIPIAPNGP